MIIKSYIHSLGNNDGYIYVIEYDNFPFIRQSIFEYQTREKAENALKNAIEFDLLQKKSLNL
jgi:hypothetical protein